MKDDKTFFSVTVFAEIDLEQAEYFPETNGFMFSIPKILRKEAFFDQDESPNELSTRMITKMLVEALSGNIHAAHQKGVYDSAKHLRDIIEQLETLFVSNCKVDVGFEDKIGFLKSKKRR